MPASTPAPWSIPYPVGTDRVADGDNSMQAIAERLNAILDALAVPTLGGTAWVIVGSGGAAPPFQNGWITAFGHTVKYRRDAVGNVHIRGVMNGGANATTAWTLPVGFRPNSQLNLVGSGNNTSGFPAGAAITAAGLIQPSYGTGGTFVGIDCVFSALA